MTKLFVRDYSDRWRPESNEKPDYSNRSSRSILDPNRSLGSVIKLLTPSREYTDQYNQWLRSIPGSIYAMAFIIKRFAKAEWNGNWRSHFSVDVVNGEPGHELKYHNRTLVGMYLRVGLDSARRWQTYKLRQDFSAAFKIQLEDDITASVVVPGEYLNPQVDNDRSYKFVANCEYRLFQRPDDAIHRGLDKQTEADMAQTGNFFCNFEPLNHQQTQAIVADVLHFDQFTHPMQALLRDAFDKGSPYVVSSAHPRIVDGEPSKNPRYLQDRLDLTKPEERYIAMRGLRLYRRLAVDAPIYQPVSAVLSGRRNNPPDKQAGIRSLAVYNPIHYQQLPELFMDYICSLTGKSPSTTGAGSEGALTKGPFNAILPIHDLNAALVSMILTRLGGYSTAAGFVGSEVEVGHDVSLLVPEIWCRLTAEERDPDYLIAAGMLQELQDFEYQGRTIAASRLGFRITARFVRRLFGRMFDNPDKVFDERILCPETQDMESFADGIDHIVQAQQRVALQYFEDGSFNFACPPLQAVLSVMAHGNWNGKSIKDADVRAMFTREVMLKSDWYRARLRTKRNTDIAMWRRHLKYLQTYCNHSTHADVVNRMQLRDRIRQAEDRLAFFNTDAYLQRIEGTLGTDPVLADDRSDPPQK
jgi:phosphoenolpyruvate carboxykinase (diphosphate)